MRFSVESERNHLNSAQKSFKLGERERVCFIFLFIYSCKKVNEFSQSHAQLNHRANLTIRMENEGE